MEINKMRTKDLLLIAKDLNIIGRHNLKKAELIKAIESKSQTTRDLNKKRYENSVQLGTIVAFVVNENVMFSGKIVEIYQDKFGIQTKNGIKYLVKKSDVKWYKTGSRWPKGIYQELVKEKKYANAN